MTLKARNRLLIIFFIITLLYALLNTVAFIMSVLEGSLSFPQDAQRQIKILDGLGFMSYEPLAVCASSLTFNAYVLIITLILYLSFEKTQALETIYFLGFLLSCMAEGTRLFVPVSSIAETSSSSVAIITRIVIGARMLAPLSFLFAELFSDTESRLFVERNFTIMLLASIFIGMLIPLDTQGYTSIFTYRWGIQNIFQTTRFLLVAATVLAIACKILTTYSTDELHEGIGFLISISGYFILSNSDTFILTIIGGVTLFTGTLYYLRSMHRTYRWR
ncbi:MAG: hypothetical protein IJR93_07750 [Treponema sp.]|nr:hypothetical protein [Treponema sp.]